MCSSFSSILVLAGSRKIDTLWKTSSSGSVTGTSTHSPFPHMHINAHEHPHTDARGRTRCRHGHEQPHRAQEHRDALERRNFEAAQRLPTHIRQRSERGCALPSAYLCRGARSAAPGMRGTSLTRNVLNDRRALVDSTSVSRCFNAIC
jgi:hypothetical protein